VRGGVGCRARQVRQARLPQGPRGSGARAVLVPLLHQREDRGRYTSRYEGKQLRPELAEEFGPPPGSTAVREDAEGKDAEDRHRDT